MDKRAVLCNNQRWGEERRVSRDGGMCGAYL